MNEPLVSVCLPNLNTRPYLEERVESIFSQTYRNWEMVVSDNFSDDGAWEYFQEVARRDDRVLIEQAPKQGLYANWNNCIRRARGKYVYIATSDDTMAPDCLEKMVAALERHPECDLAHCTLRVIDSKGEPADYPVWPECTVFAYQRPELAKQRHIRHAPYDGLLHLTGEMVYFSITELLIRRSLFEKTGYFESRWGSMGDRNWDMKAGLVANVIHVPDTWASWRVHPAQATAGTNQFPVENTRKVEEMIDDALAKCGSLVNPSVASALQSIDLLESSRDLRLYYAGLRHRAKVVERRVFQGAEFLKGKPATRSEILGRLRGQPKWTDRLPQRIETWLDSLGVGPMVSAC